MQMKKIISTLSVIILLQFNNAFAQETCKVLLESIAGAYSGECSKGKANGKGKSVGAETYEGLFKNGLPDGEGMYTFKDGHYYMGNFEKGKMDGAGKMYFEAANGQDSIISGFWNKGAYVGAYEKPYKIHDVTSAVGRVEVSKAGKGNSITLELKSMSSGMSASFTGALTDIRIQSGNYLSKSTTRLTNAEITIFKGVTYPLRAAFVFGVSTVEIEFYEDADYRVMVPLQ